MVPTLDFASTNIQATKQIETKTRGLYAAEAGIEDALWTLKYSLPGSFPYSYVLNDINSMSASVTIDTLSELAGIEIGPTGVHGGWLKVDKSAEWADFTYTYTLSIRNDGAGNMKIEQILIDFQPDLEYVPGSTLSNITTEDPLVVGSPGSGITLVWDLPTPYYSIGVHSTELFSFQLTGPQMDEPESHAMIKASREDIGVVWDSDSQPFSITSQAKNDDNDVVATVKVGTWRYSTQLDITCWQVNP
jgi:hypothetical protein